ncbi:chemotaxis regulator, protein-glutamate methyltransferase [uncultured Desulfatiglans sp.]|uniref:protein-glutamate O-methyltransferase n=1 Tax=Uncultured Desulfatiglans sp. TaxID=1748965 RepID=A0A653A389_UNCDX|nr:chemotaxis regulator, protein-glutamate methyltransferase [uncultured Desulfatiglans sp.]
MELGSPHLTDGQFKAISRLVYDICGISLNNGKKSLVRARLMKRLRALRMQSFREYLRYLESEAGRGEIDFMIDVITTNKTNFFREIDHFDFLRTCVLPTLRGTRLRFWCAACSSGEEPYSLAMVLRESLIGMDWKDVRVLATDISTRMLKRARAASYTEEAVQEIPSPMRRKYFDIIQRDGQCYYMLKMNVRSLVSLGCLNLMGPWPMKGPFDVIFCRNVMIYFDRPTQQRLVQRFWELLRPEGYLFVGHSEGLSGVVHRFQYVQPAVYRK